MKFVEVIGVFRLLYSSRKHLLQIKQQLQKESFETLIKQTYGMSCSTSIPIKSRVKSYFWASRTIKDCHCLNRSIALYQHLKAMGLNVEYKFGVNKRDKKLAAHAWVEYQGEPLNESIDLYDRFTVLEQPNDDFIGSLM